MIKPCLLACTGIYFSLDALCSSEPQNHSQNLLKDSSDTPSGIFVLNFDPFYQCINTQRIHFSREFPGWGGYKAQNPSQHPEIEMSSSKYKIHEIVTIFSWDASAFFLGCFGNFSWDALGIFLLGHLGIFPGMLWVFSVMLWDFFFSWDGLGIFGLGCFWNFFSWDALGFFWFFCWDALGWESTPQSCCFPLILLITHSFPGVKTPGIGQTACGDFWCPWVLLWKSRLDQGQGGNSRFSQGRMGGF